MYVAVNSRKEVIVIAAPEGTFKEKEVNVPNIADVTPKITERQSI